MTSVSVGRGAGVLWAGRQRTRRRAHSEPARRSTPWKTGSPRVFFVALVLGVLVIRANAIAGENTAAGVCMKEGHKIVGERAISIDRRAPMPRKVRHVATKYPDWPPDIVGSGGWSGDLLLDKQGRVVQVWTTRDVKFNRAGLRDGHDVN
jgi:hypothetical protein